MPPKLTLPIIGVCSRSISNTFPGIARHMMVLSSSGLAARYRLRQTGPRCRIDLTQRDTAVVRRNPLVPVHCKSLFFQSVNRALKKQAVLEAAAAEDDPRIAVAACDFDDQLGEGTMELRAQRLPR